MTIADAPTPRRMRRPRWLDVRVVGGVLLLVASVVIGAKVIGASSRTSPVWAAAQDLATGTVLRAEDLVKTDVNLGDRGASYLDASSVPDGHMLNRQVRKGELLPATAIGPVGDGRIVSVAVTADHMAPGVQHGSVIDLYLTTGGKQFSGDEPTTRLLQGGVTVQSVAAPASGGLSAATSSRFQVALLLSPADARALVGALPAGEPLVVLQTSRSGDGAAGALGDDAGGSGTTGRGPSSHATSSPSVAPSRSGG